MNQALSGLTPKKLGHDRTGIENDRTKIENGGNVKGKKIVPALAAGSLMAIVSWALRQWGGIEMPGEVVAAAVTLFTIVISLLTPDSMEAP